ncbi:FxLYD domain-containing protein [Escherichia coli]|uniref:FxLYD domain-containing protein n=1 Tax=Escherichia coli TaxID=562 RepID=UPI00396CA64E
MNLKNIILSTVLSIASCHALAVGNSQIALSNLHVENTPSGTKAIVGYAENKSNSVVKNAYIKFNLLKDGVVIGQTIDTASNLEPGQKWKIQAFINTFNGSPDSFKVTEVKVVN